ncbi:hypothetical protein A5727_01350 [Mycobacterium sp. ACS4331]|nr:hypothetical protein A5727_01350 [Mycobacterium sp. ACS4331]
MGRNLTDTDLDWGRAVLVGAAVGGAFWALAVFAVAKTHAAPSAMIIGAAVAVAVMIIGAVVLRRATGARVRSLALGAILAPLTGVMAVVPFCVVALLVGLVTRVGP